MNKYIIVGLLAIISMSFMSCSNDEEILVPTQGYIDNKFRVPDDATGPEAEIRRAFYNITGCNLLFNDLLSHEYKGKDANGDDVYVDEYIDFEYNLVGTGGSSVNGPRFDYIEDIDVMRESANLIKTYIYPHIEGGSLMPFSIMPTLGIYLYDYNYDTYEYEYMPTSNLSCWRCLAIDVKEWLSLPDDEKNACGLNILVEIITKKLDYRADEVDEFSEISYDYNGEYLSDMDENWDRSDMSLVYECGFLSYVQSRYSSYSDYLPYLERDYNDYIKAAIIEDEQDFRAKYADYPIIISKYDMVRDILKSHGYKF